jgi:hypothetical protein
VKDYKQIAKDRIAKAGDMTYIDRMAYGGHDIVYCHNCVAPIRKMVPDDSHREVKRVNGQTVIYERLVMATLPNYVEARVALADGGTHDHCMCRTCAEDPNLNLEELWCAVMVEFMLDEERGLGAVDWSRWAERKPVKIVKVHVPG